MKIGKFDIKFAGYWAHPFFYTTYVGTGEALPDDPDTEAYRLDSINIGPFIVFVRP